MLAKLDAKGKIIDKPILLDTTTDVNYNNNTKIYTVLNSENKQQIMLLKINTKNDRSHILTTLLFSKDLNLQKRSRILIPMPERNDFLTEFALDNEGDLVCIKGSGTAQNDNINKISLISKTATADTVMTRELKITGTYLDDIRLKVDNMNKHYVVCSFLANNVEEILTAYIIRFGINFKTRHSLRSMQFLAMNFELMQKRMAI